MNQGIRQRVERAITALKQGRLIILTDDSGVSLICNN